MKVIQDNLWFCVDCLMVACNGDTSGIDEGSEEKTEQRIAEVNAGIEALGLVVPAFDSETGKGIDEFSWSPCDCCGSHLGGSRHEFAVLGEDK